MQSVLKYPGMHPYCWQESSYEKYAFLIKLFRCGSNKYGSWQTERLLSFHFRINAIVEQRCIATTGKDIKAQPQQQIYHRITMGASPCEKPGIQHCHQRVLFLPFGRFHTFSYLKRITNSIYASLFFCRQDRQSIATRLPLTTY